MSEKISLDSSEVNNKFHLQGNTEPKVSGTMAAPCRPDRPPSMLLQIRRQYKGRPVVLMLFTPSFSLIRPNWPHESGGFRSITPGLSPRRSCKLGGKIRAASRLGAVRGVNGYERC